MISLRSLSVPMFALVAVLAGCASETTSSTGASTANSQQAAVVAQGDTTTAAAPQGGPGRHGGGGGPDMLIGAALHDDALKLTDAQKTTISGLKDSLHQGGDRPAFDQTQATALAAAIRKGDLSTITPPAPDQAKMQAHLADSAKAIQTLHDTLTADQRTQLVTDVQSRGAKGGGDHGDHKGGRPAWANGREGQNAMRDPGGPFVNELNLTDAQKAQLAAKEPAKPTEADVAAHKANFDAMRTAMNAKLETFKGASFDATAFVTPAAGFQAPAGGDMHQNHLANLVSILTPAQREILAQKIEAGPPAQAH